MQSAELHCDYNNTLRNALICKNGFENLELEKKLSVKKLNSKKKGRNVLDAITVDDEDSCGSAYKTSKIIRPSSARHHN